MDRPIVRVWLPTFVFLTASLAGYSLLTSASTGQRFGFATAMVGALLHFLAAAYFLLGFRYFKDKLRHAYVYISAGLAMLGVADSQLTIIDLFGWWFWTRSGIVILPFLASVVLVFLGAKRFAKELKVSSRWFSLGLVTVCALALAVIGGAMPHAPTSDQELTHRAATGLALLSTMYFVFVFKGILLIRKRAGSSYTNSLAWFSVALMLAVLGGLQYGLALIFIPGDNWYFNYHLTNLFFLVSGWFFMRAGYAFSTIGTTPSAGLYPKSFRSFLGVKAATKEDENAATTSLDVMCYAASLASNPMEIDNILDGFRYITAKLQSPQDISAEDQAKLAKVYLKLETYLTDHEPLRKFTRQDVRQAIQTKFGPENLTHTFWPLLNKN